MRILGLDRSDEARCLGNDVGLEDGSPASEAWPVDELANSMRSMEAWNAAFPWVWGGKEKRRRGKVSRKLEIQEKMLETMNGYRKSMSEGPQRNLLVARPLTKQILAAPLRWAEGQMGKCPCHDAMIDR